jgi:poly-beta-1,6-N-acetyl-D-glucosamine synthase
MSSSRQKSGSYVLMTAAHNEEAFIEGTIWSVLSQTILPQRWVIVIDNSSDRTDEIVERYARQYDFIRFLRITRASGYSFGAKVRALHKGFELLENLSYDFIGNLDADISLEPSYFEQLVRHLRQNHTLGLVGGFVYENSRRGYRSRRINDAHNVPHAAQLVRRECYDAIGGYTVLKYGGEDWYAQTKARMLGWHVESFPQLKIFHHRHTGASSSPLRNAFRLGKMDYSFGSDPAFEVIKCLHRVNEKPYVLATLARLAGFIWPRITREQREAPTEFAAFLRREQQERLFSLFKRIRLVRPMPTASRFRS